MEFSSFKFKDKYSYNLNDGEKNHTSTFTGEEDYEIFKINAGFIIGGEISVKKTNPLKKLKTNKWHRFLLDSKEKAKNKITENKIVVVLMGMIFRI